MLRIRFTGYFIDSWDDERFILNVDGNTIVEKAYQHASGENICGAGWNERFEDFDIYLAHTNT